MSLNQRGNLSACNTEEDETGRAHALYEGGRLRGYTEPQPIRQCSWRRVPMMVGRPGLHQPGSCCSGMDRERCPCESTMTFQPAKLRHSHTLNVGWMGWMGWL